MRVLPFFALVLVGCGGNTFTSANSGLDASTADAASDATTRQDASNDADTFDVSPPPVDGAGPCRVDEPRGCPAGSYCRSDNCTTGVCTPRPAESPHLSPVCGCDNITYWNEAIAGARGVSLKSKSVCNAGKSCGGIGNLQCPTNTFCNHEETSCLVSDSGGTCWGLPTQCGGGVGLGPNTRQCNAQSCADRCSLIRAEKAYVVDPSCPQ